MARVSYAACESRPVTSGRSARRTAAAYSGRVARCTSSWCRISITPRPSRASRSVSSAPSTVFRSASVACWSSRTFSGRLELNRIASSVADTSFTLGFPRLDVNRPEPLLLADADDRASYELEHRDEGADRLEPVLRLEYELDELD